MSGDEAPSASGGDGVGAGATPTFGGGAEVGGEAGAGTTRRMVTVTGGVPVPGASGAAGVGGVVGAVVARVADADVFAERLDAPTAGLLVGVHQGGADEVAVEVIAADEPIVLLACEEQSDLVVHPWQQCARE